MTQTRNSQWIVRAGEARADFLQTGYAEHKLVPGLFGFSVQFAPGKSVEELARAGRFRNATISYADLSDLQTAVAVLSYRADVIASPGTGYHHTFVVLYDMSNALLTQLPRPVAEAISNTFTRITNPHRVQ